MMEATQDWEGDNVASCARSLTHAVSWLGNSLVDTLMRSRPIEVLDILLQNVMQMLFTKNEDVIDALTPYAPQQPLTDRIGARRLDWRSEHLDACSDGDGFEMRTVLRIVVADQVRR